MSFEQYTRQPGNDPYFSVNFTEGLQKPETKRTRRLFIDNRDRPDNTNPFHFTIGLDNTGTSYENVSSVELKGVCVPKVEGEPYVIIDIPELNDFSLDSTNDPVNKAFAVVYFDTNQMTPGDIKPAKGADFYLKQIQYSPPLRRLDKLTLIFRKYDGSVISTYDTGGIANVSALFEITCGVRSN